MHNAHKNIAYAAAMAIKDYINWCSDQTIQGFLSNFDPAIEDLRKGMGSNEISSLEERTNLTLIAAIDFLYYIIINLFSKEISNKEEYEMEDLLKSLEIKAK